VGQIDVLMIAVGEQSLDGRQAMPVGIALLKAILKQAGFTVKCLDNTIKKLSDTQLIEFIKKISPKVIGLSATAYFISQLKEMVRLIKSISIEIAVIIGGYCSLVDNLVKQTNADAVCHGEGDLTIVELVRHYTQPFEEWINGREQIKGVSFLEGGNIIRTDPRPLIEDLNCLPFPDYSDFEFSEYSKDSWINNYVQRGCYNNCNFCDILPFYKEQRIRSMDPKRIVEWIEDWHRNHGQQYFSFNDDNFMSTREFLSGFLNELNTKDLLGKIWINFQTRIVDILRFKDLLDQYKPIIFSMELGIESFADSQLRRYHKNTTAAQNLEAIRLLCEKRIPFEIYYMFLDEGTTIEELEQNVDTILSLPPVPFQYLPEPVPEIVVNYQYNVCSDIFGIMPIDRIPFLSTFNYFLDETEGIKNAFILYRCLKYIENDLQQKTINLSDFQISLFTGMGKALYPLTVELGQKRLQKALKLSLAVFNKKWKIKARQDHAIQREIQQFNEEVEQLLAPIKKMGLDFQALRDLY
jgi:radical SAM superfamily enzyme YgiQ (UPF0313 family)